MKHFFCACLLLTISNFIYGQKNFIDQPYIETSAVADTLIKPDIIYLQITLLESDSRNRKSVEELEQDMRAALLRQNIDTNRQLTLLDLSSEFKRMFLKGNTIMKMKAYSVKLSDAYTAVLLLKELENVGISNVEVTKVTYSKLEDVLYSLRTTAAAKCRKNAELMAAGVGQKPGKAIFISDLTTPENSRQGMIDGFDKAKALSLYGSRADDNPMFVEYQKIKFEVKLTAKFVIE